MVRYVRAEKMVLSGLVFARKIARMILIQDYRVWWVPWWHLCLYICEKCEMSRLWHTNGRTHEQWKVGQYSVWAESAKTKWQERDEEGAGDGVRLLTRCPSSSPNHELNKIYACTFIDLRMIKMMRKIFREFVPAFGSNSAWLPK